MNLLLGNLQKKCRGLWFKKTHFFIYKCWFDLYFYRLNNSILILKVFFYILDFYVLDKQGNQRSETNLDMLIV